MAIVKAIHFTSREMTIHFFDGEEAVASLAEYPKLLNATAKQRKHWQELSKGRGIHWPEIDEDLSIPALRKR